MDTFVTCWDCKGFSWIWNLSAHERARTWNDISNGPVLPELPYHVKWSLARAQANQDQSPEVWAFESELAESDLEELSLNDPEILIKAIRSVGRNLYGR